MSISSDLVRHFHPCKTDEPPWQLVGTWSIKMNICQVRNSGEVCGSFMGLPFVFTFDILRNKKHESCKVVVHEFLMIWWLSEGFWRYIGNPQSKPAPKPLTSLTFLAHAAPVLNLAEAVPLDQSAMQQGWDLMACLNRIEWDVWTIKPIKPSNYM